jgi:hypothetical protein
MRGLVFCPAVASALHPHLQDIVTAAGGGGAPGPVTVESAPASAGGGPPEHALLEHFVFHAPPRRQFLMPQLRSATDAERTRSQASLTHTFEPLRTI